MGVKEHYDQHLGNFYSWMSGDFNTRVREFKEFLVNHQIRPKLSKIAIDLGAGHGIQSVALSKAGFTVQAIDFNDQLLKQLHKNAEKYDIHVIKDDLRNFKNYCTTTPELIICWGDTLTHLDNETEVEKLIVSCSKNLQKGGLLLLSFRDYTTALEGDQRFIPVKSDGKRILTCFLEFFEKTVRVTDILHEKSGDTWVQKISSYQKVRLEPRKIKGMLEKNGFSIKLFLIEKGLVKVVAEKL